MKFKIFEKLKHLTISGEINYKSAEHNIQSAIDYLLEERSVTSLRLFSAICNLHISKGYHHSFFQDSNNKSLQLSFERDPSDFFVVYLYALSKFCCGEEARASQLFVRLEKSGWKNKVIAKEMNEKLLMGKECCG